MGGRRRKGSTGRLPKALPQQKIVQTLHVGAGESIAHIERAAERFPHKRYAVVDDLYCYGRFKELRKKLEGAGISVYPNKIHEAVKMMRENGIMARHINFDMPYPRAAFYRFSQLFREIAKGGILLPNGKIFIKSESCNFLNEVGEIAARFGLKAKPPKLFLSREMLRKQKRGSAVNITDTMRRVLHKGKTIYLLEITLGLKKAAKSTRQQEQ
jgi:hypothetical protein